MRSRQIPDGRGVPGDAIVVLGCADQARLARRVGRGIELFHGRAASILLLSGGGRRAEPEAAIMQRLALASGVPEKSLMVEPRSRNTWENACESARLLRQRGLNRVVLVSDRIHLPRAALLFRLAGLELAGWSGVPARSPGSAAAAAIREIAALPKSLLRAGRRRSRQR
jgi:uncharacterized SAM-binding protein YcdF (DUF218 family)